jgi:Domain of unknown function (DUF1835)
MLHVTNGTSVSLAATGLAGDILVWLDALHEGPVPSGVTDDELRRVRGIFLDSEWHGEVSAATELARRDQMLAAHDEVVLWFEHDLYDQLQLIQILDRLRRSHARLSLICTDHYLGPMTPEQLAGLWPSRHAVQDAELALAAQAWQAFRSSDPIDVQALLARDTRALPFLAGALRRHLQQFPAAGSGVARTERQILEVLAGRPHNFRTLFAAEQRMEERIFMGDLSLMRYVRAMVNCPTPLIREEEGVYLITDMGIEVLAGRADHVRVNGINRWLGGVHLIGNDVLWRWDESAGKLQRR